MSAGLDMPILKHHYNNLHYIVKELEESDLKNLETFCQACAKEGVVNNSSFKAMKLNHFEKGKWWVVYNEEKNIIVSVAGVHPFDEYLPGCWRIMFRMATLKEFRGKAGPVCKDQRNCFGWGVMLPLQIAYCRQMQATKIVFTTNCDQDGDVNSQKQNKICELVFERFNMAKKIDQKMIYYQMQNVWEVLIEDVISKKKLIL